MAPALLILAAGCSVNITSEVAAIRQSNGSLRCNGSFRLLCHIPPGNDELPHSICVGDPAEGAHRAHGDPDGACAIDLEDGGTAPEADGGAATDGGVEADAGAGSEDGGKNCSCRGKGKGRSDAGDAGAPADGGAAADNADADDDRRGDGRGDNDGDGRGGGFGGFGGNYGGGRNDEDPACVDFKPDHEHPVLLDGGTPPEPIP
jgi:hypothetical protein